MKYIVCDDPNNFSLKAKEQPTFTAGSALLKVKRVGICGTDLHAFKGNQAFFSYPRILGHELATEILEIDTNDAGLSPGDKAVLIPYINCEKCAACKAGNQIAVKTLKSTAFTQMVGCRKLYRSQSAC